MQNSRPTIGEDWVKRWKECPMESSYYLTIEFGLISRTDNNMMCGKGHTAAWCIYTYIYHASHWSFFGSPVAFFHNAGLFLFHNCYCLFDCHWIHICFFARCHYSLLIVLIPGQTSIVIGIKASYFFLCYRGITITTLLKSLRILRFLSLDEKNSLISSCMEQLWLKYVCLDLSGSSHSRRLGPDHHTLSCCSPNDRTEE